jgi:type IV pilus assembly protein PilY1
MVHTIKFIYSLLQRHGALLRKLAAFGGLSVYGFLSAVAIAAPLNISTTPLFLTSGVKPNLIMAIDDSGSMDFETLLPGNDGAAWWRINNQASGSCTAAVGSASFAGCVADGATDQPAAGKLNFNNSGNGSAAWRKFAYLFPNGSGGNTSNQRRLTDTFNADNTGDHFPIPPIGDFAWSRASEFNTAYFDPDTLYTPWLNGGGFTFVNSPINAARFDPVYVGAGTVNLEQDIAGTVNVATTDVCQGNAWPIAANYYFRVYTGMTLPAGTCVRRSATGGGWLQNEWVRVGAAGCAVGTANACIVHRNNNVLPEAPWTLPNASAVAIRYFPATFFATDANAPSAAFGFNNLMRVADGKTPDGLVMYRYEIKPLNFTTPAAYTAAIQNFANWFTYYRKRHQALRAGLGKAFNTVSSMRVGGFTINQTALATSPDVNPVDIDLAANRTALYTNFYQNWTGSGGTPNRPAVANIIRNFKRTGNTVVTNSCQRNFGMLFTDGFSNPPANDGAGYPAIANVDNTVTGTTPYNTSGVDPYKDGVSNTVADLVMGSYVNTIRPDLTQGRVQPPAACADATHDPWLDCNKNPHMNFYAITLGSRGLRFNPDWEAPTAPGTPNPYQIDAKEFPYMPEPAGWPTYAGTWPSNLWPTSITAARNPVAVDDLWHAAVNGRGQLLNARKSTDLADKLSSVLRSIAETEGSAASASVNSGTVNNDTRTFTASFGTKNWSGYLKAIRLNADGSLGVEYPGTLPAAPSRRIFTVTSTGTAVPFQWADIGATRQTQLQPSADGLGSRRLDYLRGDRTLELPAAGGLFRKRDTVMGDIVNSAPVYVGAPPFRYKDSMETQPYSAFFATNKFRKRMVYVGGNDGMLHAFWTDDDPNLGAGFGTGALEERFAFVPGEVFKNLYRLTEPTYTHRFYVDGTPSVIDAFFKKGGSGPAEWRTVLAAGLNRGGQGIYTLDITDPFAITEATAGNSFMWEFTDADDADLGYTYSRPAVVKMHNGKWAVVFGNGYNNTSTDGGADTHVSVTGRAALYVVDIETGVLLRKIVVPAGMTEDPLGQSRPNGLATPAVVDADGDDIVDVAYAGDVFGNLWKFDLRDAAPGNWDVAIKTAGVGVPMFVARNAANQVQPITTRPQVGRGPNGFGLSVLFGTGKFLEDSDRNIVNLVPQSFYGLYDRTNIVIPRATLRQQSILDEQNVDLDGDGKTTPIRITSALAVNTVTQNGWYMDLVSPIGGFEGEMQVSDSVLRNGRISFSSLIPDIDPCGFGGRSWFTIVDAITGARLDASPFDLNKDKKFNDADLVTITVAGVTIKVPASAVGNDAIMSAVRYVASDGADLGIITDTSNDTTAFRINPGAGRVGRQSWRQLR